MVGMVELAPGESVLFIPQGGTPELQDGFLEVLRETWQLVPHHQQMVGSELCRSQSVLRSKTRW